MIRMAFHGYGCYSSIVVIAIPFIIAIVVIVRNWLRVPITKVGWLVGRLVGWLVGWKVSWWVGGLGWVGLGGLVSWFVCY